MKKTAIILTLCMLASLAGCGKIDSEESKPLNIQRATINSTENNSEEDSESSLDESRTEQIESEETVEIIHLTTNATFTVPVTTAKTGTAILVKRSTVAAPNIPQSRGTVRIPTASTVPKTTTVTHTSAKTNTTNTTKTTGTKTNTTGSTTVTTVTTTINPADVTNGDITCRVQENGVEIIRDGNVIQLIEVDTERMLSFYENGITDPSSLISISDFDFDGYDDLFIPQEIGTLNTLGIYMHYNPETEAFEEWSEMSDISVYSWTGDDYTLHTCIKNNALENESKTYIWNDEKQLELISSIIQYRLDDKPENQYNIYIDYFEYPDGTETLVKREKLLFNENNEFIGTEEIPLDEPPTETTTEQPTEVTTEENTE